MHLRVSRHNIQRSQSHRRINDMPESRNESRTLCSPSSDKSFRSMDSQPDSLDITKLKLFALGRDVCPSPSRRSDWHNVASGILVKRANSIITL